MARTKGAISKSKKLPDSVELISMAVSEQINSIKFLSKVRDGKFVTETGSDEEGNKVISQDYDNKDKASAAKALLDLGKFYYDLAEKKGLFDDSEAQYKEEVQQEKVKEETSKVFKLKGFK